MSDEFTSGKIPNATVGDSNPSQVRYFYDAAFAPELTLHGECFSLPPRKLFKTQHSVPSCKVPTKSLVSLFAFNLNEGLVDTPQSDPDMAACMNAYVEGENTFL